MTPYDGIVWAELWPYMLVGFVAQLVDGALGMAFGLVGSLLLLLTGMSPAAAIASLHTVEAFTAGASGISHAAQRNVDWRLLGRLAVPGIAGGAIGAWFLTRLSDEVVRPLILVYLCATGLYLLWRGVRRPRNYGSIRLVGPLGLLGGLADGSGGGGWGPIVTANLLSQGMQPRIAIGTVNAAEFFVTVTITVTFAGALGWQAMTPPAAGLLAGGIFAAPFGAYLAGRLPSRLLVGAVAGLLVAASLLGLMSRMIGPIPVPPGF